MSIKLLSTSGGSVTIQEPNTASDFTLSVPANTTTIVGTDTTQTLTNKTIQGGAISSATSVNASGTTTSFTNIPSWVKRITFMLSGVSSSGGSNWLIQLGTSGGFVTSGYLGAGAYAGGTNISGGTNFTSGFGIQNGGGAQIFHGQLVLSLFDSSTNTWVASGVYGDSSQAYIFTTGGSVPLSGVATQIRITHTNPADSFDAGKFNIIYE